MTSSRGATHYSPPRFSPCRDCWRARGCDCRTSHSSRIHEAFAATVLTTLAAWESAEFCRARLGLDAPIGALDSRLLNVKGSSLAAGHPFAATGGRIVASLAKMLHEKGTGARELISICAAGGQGVLMILEAA